VIGSARGIVEPIQEPESSLCPRQWQWLSAIRRKQRRLRTAAGHRSYLRECSEGWLQEQFAQRYFYFQNVP
jgi:hypothetical protein